MTGTKKERTANTRLIYIFEANNNPPLYNCATDDFCLQIYLYPSKT